MSDLKPCPVCGGAVEAHDAIMWECSIHITCTPCGYIFEDNRGGGTHEDLAVLWNSLPRQCRHEWMVVSDGPNMPSRGMCRKCGSPMGTVTEPSDDFPSGEITAHE